MERLSRFDMLQFSEYYADMKYLESKTGRSLVETEKPNDKRSGTSEETCSPRKTQDKDFFRFDALLRSAADMVFIQIVYLTDHICNICPKISFNTVRTYQRPYCKIWK